MGQRFFKTWNLKGLLNMVRQWQTVNLNIQVTEYLILNITHQISSTSSISHMTNPSQSVALIPENRWIFKLPNSFQRCVSSKFPRRHQNVSPVWSGPAPARNVSAAHLVMSPSAVAPSHQVPNLNNMKHRNIKLEEKRKSGQSAGKLYNIGNKVTSVEYCRWAEDSRFAFILLVH